MRANFSVMREDKVKSLGHNESGGVQKHEILATSLVP